MAFGPQKKEPAEIVTFRCPVPELRWLRSYESEKVKLSSVAAWAVKMGREYVEATGDLDQRITQLADEEGLARGAFVANVLAAGLAVLERERKSKK